MPPNDSITAFNGKGDATPEVHLWGMSTLYKYGCDRIWCSSKYSKNSNFRTFAYPSFERGPLFENIRIQVLGKFDYLNIFEYKKNINIRTQSRIAKEQTTFFEA